MLLSRSKSQNQLRVIPMLANLSPVDFLSVCLPILVRSSEAGRAEGERCPRAAERQATAAAFWEGSHAHRTRQAGPGIGGVFQLRPQQPLLVSLSPQGRQASPTAAQAGQPWDLGAALEIVPGHLHPKPRADRSQPRVLPGYQVQNPQLGKDSSKEACGKRRHL